MAKALDTVRRFYDITENKKGKGLRELLTDDMTFVGPVMKATSADEYVAMNEQVLPFHVETRMLAQFERGDEVCSLYDMDLRTPAGGQITLRMADWITVRDGRVAAQEILYDPREFAKAFGLETTQQAA